MNCWKDWLARKNTCFQCREHTEMKTLSKMVFTNSGCDGVIDNASFTQYCESDSDNEELEIIAK